MAGSDPQPKKATPPRLPVSASRKPLQVMHISRKAEEEVSEEKLKENSFTEPPKNKNSEEEILGGKIISPSKKSPDQKEDNIYDSSEDLQSLTIEDLLNLEGKRKDE